MPDVVALGPVVLQGITVKLVLSALAAWLCTRWMYRKAGLWDPAYSDLLSHMAFIAIVVWKISPLVFHISDALNRPLLYLLAPGAREGLWAGAALAAVYAAAAARRRRLALPQFADAFALGAVIAVFVYNLLGWRYGVQTNMPWGIAAADPAFRYHPVNAYTGLLAAGIFVSLRSRFVGAAKPGAAAADTMMWLGAGMLAISFSQPTLHVWLGLSLEQWLCAALALSGITLARIDWGNTR